MAASCCRRCLPQIQTQTRTNKYARTRTAAVILYFLAMTLCPQSSHSHHLQQHRCTPCVIGSPAPGQISSHEPAVASGQGARSFCSTTAPPRTRNSCRNSWELCSPTDCGSTAAAAAAAFCSHTTLSLDPRMILRINRQLLAYAFSQARTEVAMAGCGSGAALLCAFIVLLVRGGACMLFVTLLKC